MVVSKVAVKAVTRVVVTVESLVAWMAVMKADLMVVLKVATTVTATVESLVG